MKKLVLCILLCLLAGFSVFAGGKSDEITQAKNSKTKLTFWMHQNTAFKTAIENAIEAYEAENPNVEILLESYPYEDFWPKLQAAYAGKAESDIQQVFGGEVSAYIRHGLFDPVPAALTKKIKEEFFNAPVEGFSKNGILYGVPNEVNIGFSGILNFPDKVKAAGYNEFPTDYDEVIKLAQALTEYDSNGNILKAGLDINGYDEVGFLLFTYIVQQGGTYWAKDGVHVDFTTPEAKIALQEIVDYFLKYRIASTKHGVANEAWFQGFTGISNMVSVGPWVLPIGKSDYGLDNYAYNPWPPFAGNKMRTVSESGWAVVVSANSKNKEAAWEFVEFLNNEKNALAFNVASGTVPAVKKVAYSDAYAKAQPKMVSVVAQLADISPMGPIPNSWAVKEIIYNSLFMIESGRMTVDQALVNIENETNAIIDQALAQ